jgi:hypothetical protein
MTEVSNDMRDGIRALSDAELERTIATAPTSAIGSPRYVALQMERADRGGSALEHVADCAFALNEAEPPTPPDCPCRDTTCCDGTGWTGNPYERCAEHYEAPGFGASGLY